jgi:nitrous oxidase accessory protein NosD
MRLRTFAFVAAILLLGQFTLTPRSAQAAHMVTVVGTKSATCPNPDFATIQAAVDAATPGTTIRICEGTYPEQVKITKAITLRGDNGAVIEPTGVAANTTGPSSGAPIAAVVLVEGATDVDISDLIVDGTTNGITGCAPTFVGIFYENASGDVERVAVRNVKLSASLDGCQSGDAILVDSGSGQMSVVDVEDSSIHDYQKNGITANDSGTKVEIVHNVVTGLGATTGAAQNGIQVGFGAGGHITRNTVSDNVFSPCVSVSVCAATGEGILIFQSDNVTVERNTVDVSQVGIGVNGNHAHVFDNRVSGTLVGDGIDLLGSDSDARENRIVNSARAGVFIAGNDNDVDQNQINEADFGVLKVTGSTGNVIADNEIFNTSVKVQDPSAKGLTASPIH